MFKSLIAAKGSDCLPFCFAICFHISSTVFSSEEVLNKLNTLNYLNVSPVSNIYGLNIYFFLSILEIVCMPWVVKGGMLQT